MKRHAAGRHRRNVPASESSSGDVAVRGGDLRGIWVSEPAAVDGTLEVYFVVAGTVSADRNWDRLGYVSVLSLKQYQAIRRERPASRSQERWPSG